MEYKSFFFLVKLLRRVSETHRVVVTTSTIIHMHRRGAHMCNVLIAANLLTDRICRRIY